MKRKFKKMTALVLCLCTVLASGQMAYAQEPADPEPQAVVEETADDTAGVELQTEDGGTEEPKQEEPKQEETDPAVSSQQAEKTFVMMDGLRETKELYGMNADGSMYLLEEDEDGSVEENANGRQNAPGDSDLKIVNFRANSSGQPISSMATTEYTEDGTGMGGYTCGACGADAAYLGTTGGKVKFMLGGVVGLVDASKVQVVRLSSAQSYSCYKADGTNLFHYVTLNISMPGWSSVMNVGAQPSYLTKGVTYYSYDGHYFYTDYATMLSDYRNGTRAQSVNPNNPYYNYYQFLPLRSKTAYSGEEIESAIAKNTANGSKMTGTGAEFVKNQDSYGTNALLVTGVAANESGWGSSNYAKERNNLFGLNALDSNPDNASVFSSVPQCIREFSETWCSKRYLRPGYTYYHGGFLGDKASGMNVSYASDPYWGEKAAAHAWNMDRAGGGKDRYRYTIGIKGTVNTSHDKVNVRKDGGIDSTKLYDTGTVSNYAVLIRGLSGGFYEIQSDGVLDSGRTAIDKNTGVYNMDKMYGYISKENITVVSGGDTMIDSGKQGVTYSVHAQTYGWMQDRMDGQTAGTSGESKRLEALKLELRNPSVEGGIRYRTHCQTYGWLDWVENGKISGTTGEAKRLEAIQIELTGKMKEKYDVYYRVHSQTYGWLDWAKNGQIAGSSGYAKRLEAIEIKLVEKGGKAPGETKRPNVLSHVTYQTHVQTYGWQNWKKEGEAAGTSGQSKRLEGIRIKLTDLDMDGSVEYRTHVQTYGWQAWKSDGAESGTTGQSKRLEAIQIRLTGTAAQKYDIYYRVHSQTYGWLDWAKNGELSGTTGLSKRLEAIEIRLVEKGGTAPGATARPYVQTLVEYRTSLVSGGWQPNVSGGAVSGTAGQNIAVEALQVSLKNAKYSGGVEYKAYVKETGWRNFVNNGATAGAPGSSKQIEAVRIQLTGQMDQHYDIYYRVFSEGYGWLDWAKNGAPAGTEELDKRMEAIQIVLVDKGDQAPGATKTPYISTAVQE